MGRLAFLQLVDDLELVTEVQADAGEKRRERWKRMGKAIPLTRFDATKKVPLRVSDYLRRWAQVLEQEEVFLMAFFYIDRCVRAGTIRLTHHNKFRVICTALVVAQKYLNDTFLCNAVSAKVGGVTLAELQGLEEEFLQRIDWCLHVEQSDIEQFRASLTAGAHRRREKVAAMTARAVELEKEKETAKAMEIEIERESFASSPRPESTSTLRTASSSSRQTLLASRSTLGSDSSEQLTPTGPSLLYSARRRAATASMQRQRRTSSMRPASYDEADFEADLSCLNCNSDNPSESWLNSNRKSELVHDDRRRGILSSQMKHTQSAPSGLRMFAPAAPDSPCPNQNGRRLPTSK